MPYLSSLPLSSLTSFSPLSLTRSLAFAVGLSSMGCTAAYQTGPRMPTAEDPGTTESHYRHSALETRLTEVIENRYHASDVEVGIINSFLADLDNGGVSNDVAGSAILRRGSSFKSFIFLTRNDGSIRLLEDTGASFSADPESGFRGLFCGSGGRANSCPPTMERARQQLHGVNFSVMEADAAQPGPEIVIPYGDGSFRIVNSLSLFNTP